MPPVPFIPSLLRRKSLLRYQSVLPLYDRDCPLAAFRLYGMADRAKHTFECRLMSPCNYVALDDFFAAF